MRAAYISYYMSSLFPTPSPNGWNSNTVKLSNSRDACLVEFQASTNQMEESDGVSLLGFS